MTEKMRHPIVAPVPAVVAALLCAAWLVGAVAAGESTDPLARRRFGALRGASLVLVTLDTTRADRLGAYGAVEKASPRFDALAASGWLFDRAITPVPVTLPAHASILTGLYPQSHGVRHNIEFRLDSGASTLAELLRSAGYATGAFVSAFVLDARFGLDQGFDIYDAAVGAAAGPVFPSGILERSSGATVAAALGWLRSLRPRAPFFLWVHFFEPHAPYLPPEPWRARFDGRPYEGEIAAMDEQLGRLLAAVARHDPIIVVTADHGEGLGDHGELTHSILLYEETMRVPLAVRLPKAAGAPAGRVERLVSLVDLLPSLAHLLGVRDAEQRDGQNWFARGAEDRLGVYLESLVPWIDYGWAPLTGLRTTTRKLIRAPRLELYDLENDAAERHDLGNVPARRAEAQELLARLRTFGDPFESLAPPREPTPRPVDDRTLDALRALGYLGGAGPGPPSAALADPKDQIAVANALLEAHALMQAERLDEALVLLLRLEGVSPNDRSVLQSLGKVYLRLGRLGDAERALRAFTEIRPKADVTLLLAQIALLGGRLAETGALLDQAEALDPSHGGVEIARGDLAARRGQVDRARAHYRRAAEIDPYRAAGTAAARLKQLPGNDRQGVDRP